MKGILLIASSASGPRRPPITVAEAAEYMGVPVRFIRRLIHEHRIEFLKLGRHTRIEPDELDRFIEAGRNTPPRSTGRKGA